MKTYHILGTSSSEWDVYEDTYEGSSTWIASFSTQVDAELFVKIKQINEILTS